jgi:class 3 adenylate cyclase
MSEPSAAERRLAAILVADVSGYSRLVQENEAETVHRLTELRSAISDILVRHSGRLVSSAGDGFLAVFDSALDAVAAALAMQNVTREREAAIPEEQRIRFRVGLNLGDVLVQDDDLFGDAINIAARLQEIAEPGGICASRALRDSVRGRFPCTFDRLGRRHVKNIVRPVTVYRLLPADAARPTRWTPFTATAAAILIVIVAAALWVGFAPDQADAPPHQAPAASPAKPQSPPVSRPEAKAPAPSMPVTPHEGSGTTSTPRQSVDGTALDPDQPADRIQGGR